ncbi:hypothetical protein EYF80_040137 [Liparis tanakae]|uniref:Uncharacterized protein n=1 Tax=Liparis tanakae TaxID=230148 RepID=A0A4Z2G7X2_9TELE|nr:hypothetical protein EYF80_040137 [Liparis tanakae]
MGSWICRTLFWERQIPADPERPLRGVEAVHPPHHQVADPRADGHDVRPPVGVWTQTPEGRRARMYQRYLKARHI